MRRYVLVGALFSLCGCGSASFRADSEGLKDGYDDSTFQAWCGEWALACPTTPPANVPDPNAPWSDAQWRNAFAILKAVGETPGTVGVTRAELADRALDQVASRMGIATLLQNLRARLDQSHFDHLTLAHGGVELTSAAATDYQTASGLTVSTATGVAMHVEATDDVILTGVTLGSAAGASERLASWRVTGQNVLSWTGDTRRVNDVPIKFMLDEVTGIDLGTEDIAMPKYVDLQPVIMQLKNWLTTGTRNLELPRSTFSALATNLPPLLKDQPMAIAVGSILRRLKTLTSTALTRQTKLVQGTATGEIHCRAGSMAEMIITSDFGVESLTTDGTNVAAVLYGIKARPTSGIIRAFDVRRVSLEPKKIVIRDVPILGTFTLDMTDPDNQDMELDCGE